MATTRLFARVGQLVDQLVGNRWLLLVLAVSSLISTPLAFYFYFKQAPSRQFYVREPAVRSVFVSRDTPSALEVRAHGEAIGQKDVFAVQLAFWNGGNQSIHPENVLEPIVFTTGPGTQIIEAKVLRQVRQISKVMVKRIDDQHAAVTWNILEDGDGAVVQLLLAGDQRAAVGLSGIIETSGPTRYVKERAEPTKKVGVTEYCFVIFFTVALGPGLLLGVPDAWRRRREPKGYLVLAFRAVVGAAITLGLLLFAAGWFAQKQWQGSIPPSLLDAPTDDRSPT